MPALILAMGSFICPFCNAAPFPHELGLRAHSARYPGRACILRFGARTARPVQARSPIRAAHVADRASDEDQDNDGGNQQAGDEPTGGEEDDSTTVESLDALLVHYAILCNNGRGLNDTDRAKLMALAGKISDASGILIWGLPGR